MRINKTLIIGTITATLLFILIELLEPYYFLKNDNTSQFLPAIIEGYRQLTQGTFPSINLHQLMGTPLYSIGTYANFYPPMIISYFTAEYALGNNLLTLEIFTLIHIITGYAIMHLLIKKLTKNNTIAFLGGISFTFSGYFLTLTPLWYYTTPLMIFLPLTILLNTKLQEQQTTKNTLLLGILRGTAFYTGNAQYFAYLLLFELLYMLLTLQHNNWKNTKSIIKYYAITLLLTIAITTPLLIPQLETLTQTPRGTIPFISYITSEPVNPLDYITGSILPPLLTDPQRQTTGYGPLHFAGGIFALLFFYYSITTILQKKKRKLHPTYWTALIAALLSFGIIGILYITGAFLPLIKNFRGPYKIIIFTVFFTILYGSIQLTTLINKQPKKYKEYLLTILTITTLLLSITTIYYYADNSNEERERNIQESNNYYQQLPPLNKGRTVTIITGSDFEPKGKGKEKTYDFPAWKMIGKNYASYNEYNSILGYEPFKDERTYNNIPIEASGIYKETINTTQLEEYGVAYIIITEKGRTQHQELKNLTTIYKDKDITILETKNPKSLVYHKEQTITYQQQPGKILIEGTTKGETITINLLCKKNYELTINGKKETLQCDEQGRITFNTTKGDIKGELTYEETKLLLGILLGILLLLLTTILLIKPTLLDTTLTLTGTLLTKIIKPLQKRKLLTIIMILLLITLLTYKEITNEHNAETFINTRTGLTTTIEQITLNPLTAKTRINNLTLQHEETTTQLEQLTLHAPYLTNIKRILQGEKNILITGTITNITITTPKNKEQNKECEETITITKEQRKNIYQEKTLHTTIQLTPFSKANITLQGNIKGNIQFSRYLSGTLTLPHTTKETTTHCTLFPLQEKTPLYN